MYVTQTAVNVHDIRELEHQEDKTRSLRCVIRTLPLVCL